MENMIGKLLDEFEGGRMTRRQLIQSIAVVAASAAGVAPVEGQTSKGFKTIGVNHISYQCADYAKTRDFYADLMGMKAIASKPDWFSQEAAVTSGGGAGREFANHEEDFEPTLVINSGLGRVDAGIAR